MEVKLVFKQKKLQVRKTQEFSIQKTRNCVSKSGIVCIENE